MSAPRFHALIVLGDNLSLDTPSGGPGHGAASLLYRNKDANWPEFKGRDMVTRDPSVRLLTLAQDGATTRSTFSQQMKRLPVLEDPVLVVITVGSRDILAAAGDESPNGVIADADTLYDTLTGIFDEVGRRLADIMVFVGNIPDPTNGENPPPLLAEFNTVIADIAREQGASLIDIHGHFAGRVAAGDDDGEAWLTPNLQPTVHGANELRKLYWEALVNL